jgi:hypothetical protein
LSQGKKNDVIAIATNSCLSVESVSLICLASGKQKLGIFCNTILSVILSGNLKMISGATVSSKWEKRDVLSQSARQISVEKIEMKFSCEQFSLNRTKYSHYFSNKQMQ